MGEAYSYELYKFYEERVNTEINLREKIYSAVKEYSLIANDQTIYPMDQFSQMEIRFPHGDIDAFHEIHMNDYILCIDNYRRNGRLFTFRYIDFDSQMSEIFFLDPNDNGQIWLLLFTPDLEEIIRVIKASNIDLNDDSVQNVPSF
jgi:hypothetical protein